MAAPVPLLLRKLLDVPVNIVDTIDGAKRAFAIAGRGCLVRMGEDEPRYATVAEIAARLEPRPRRFHLQAFLPL